MIKRDELTNPQSCMNRAADDEMTFVLLARDSAAPHAIRCWVAERIGQGKNTADDPQIVEAMECARRMEQQRSTMRHIRNAPELGAIHQDGGHPEHVPAPPHGSVYETGRA